MKEIFLFYGYIDKSTIDANKHPSEQLSDLYEWIGTGQEHYNIYCNSPYILNEITLIEGYTSNGIDHPLGKFSNKHFEVLEDGSIIEGKYYKSMISDDNLLNNKLGESNNRYSDLLDIVQERDNNK